MSECRCHATHGYCQCLISDTNCLEVVGTDPYRVAVILDPSADNLLATSASGLVALTPPEIANPASAIVRRSASISVPMNAVEEIPFTVVVADNSSLVPTGDAGVIIEDDGWYAISAHLRWSPQLGILFLVRTVEISVNNQRFGSFAFIPTLFDADSVNPSIYQTEGALLPLTEGTQVRVRAEAFYTSGIASSGAELASGSLAVCRLGGIA